MYSSPRSAHKPAHVTARRSARRFGVLDTTRARSLLVGAALGVLAGYLCVVAGIPVLAGHVALTLVAGLLLGGLATLAPRISGPFVIVVAVAVVAISYTPVMQPSVQSWVRRDPVPTGPLDAVVVLSSSVTADSVLDPAATERLLSALQFMRSHQARVLVTTRPAATRTDLREVSDSDQRALVTLAGDSTRWREVGPVRTTREEALRTAALLAPAASRTVAVVTSPLHTRRACAAFEGVGFHVVCVPSAERMYAINTFSGVRGRLLATADWVYERLGMLEYRSNGWVR